MKLTYGFHEWTDLTVSTPEIDSKAVCSVCYENGGYGGWGWCTHCMLRVCACKRQKPVKGLRFECVCWLCANGEL